MAAHGHFAPPSLGSLELVVERGIALNRGRVSFSGTLAGMCLTAQGHRVVVLERSRHPRFAVGESSTPLANLALAKLCERYGLDEISPLCTNGTWKRTYPDLGCGPKRGFSFFWHQDGLAFEPRADRAGELLVAANPSEEEADTQWLRTDVDRFFAERARARGVRVLEGVTVAEVRRDDGWTLNLRDDRATGREVSVDFLVDAAGGGSPLRVALEAGDHARSLATRSRAMYTHFEGVRRWSSVYDEPGGERAAHPFPSDDAALHHVFPGGWMWILRFDGDVTSVGMLLSGDPPNGSDEEEWRGILGRYPSILDQMREARATRSLTSTGWLQRRLRPASGADWLALPGAAYFIDPFLSPANAHTMLGIERLARMFEAWPDGDAMARSLAACDAALQSEIDLLDQLIHGCWASFRSFPVLAAFSMYYFAGATCSEERRRTGEWNPGDGFLLAHDERFRSRVSSAYRKVLQLDEVGTVDAGSVSAFERTVREDLEPYNVVGLADPAKRNLYPYV